MEHIIFKHVVNLGDLISVLPGIRHLYETTGKKAIIYQQLHRPGEYYIGAEHPTKDEKGNAVCFNQQCFDMMKPLLLAQDYIDGFEVYSGQPVDYDLDVVRQQIYCGAPHFPLHKWTWMAYPEMGCDLSKSWLFGHNYAKYQDKVFINLTERYRNYNINYFFLKKYEGKIWFIGTRKEHELFCNAWNIEMPYFPVIDFLELASVIKSCKFFLGNQSFAWHLAQAMHVPRILELYPFAQNCTNFGANGYEFYHQPQLEYYVDKLFNEL